MDFTIRLCEATDAMGIWALNREEMGYEFSPEETLENLRRLLDRETDRIFVAVASGTVAGYIHACDYDLLYAPHMKNIMGIAVSARYKRRGIGRALLGAVEDWARETGAAGVRLVSGKTRTGAHAFYHCCGYTGEKEQLNLKKMF